MRTWPTGRARTEGFDVNSPRTRLPAVDEANLTLDHVGQVNVFLVAGLLGSGGFVGPDGVADMTALRRALHARVKMLRPLCRIAVGTRRRHSWVDVSPDLDHHVRLISPVSGLSGLERLCADLMNAPLAMDRPLWELLIVPGATTSGVGMVLRIHHAIADGVAAVGIARQLFEEDARSSTASEHDRGVRRRRITDTRRKRGRFGVGLHRILVTLGNHDVGPTALLGTRSVVHGVQFLDVGLGGLDSHGRPFGATVNDALLCAVAGGYRAILPALQEPIPPWLPVSVPVALKRREGSANQVGVMLVRLPVGERDPDRRLELIADQTRREKPQARAQGTLELMRSPIGARIMDRVGRRQHVVAGCVTNVPGPRSRLRLCGAPVTAIWPVAVLAANVRSGVAAVSYDGRLWCAVHFDAANIPGPAFAAGMANDFTRLSAGGA